MELPAARLTIYDVTVVVVLAGPGFDLAAGSERNRIYEVLRESHPAADIALVWQDAEGRTKFLAPVQQEPFFEVVRYDQLLAQADGTVTVTPG